MYVLFNGIGVKVNGADVDKVNYTVTEGSTIVTFKKEFLETLAVGVYEVTLCYTGDRSVKTSISVIEKSTADNGAEDDEDDNAGEVYADDSGNESNGNSTTEVKIAAESTFDAYVNGVQVAKNVALNKKVSSATSAIRLSVATGGSGDIMFDNVKFWGIDEASE